MNARYAEQRESRIARMIETISIDMDNRGTFATVQSASKPGSYRVAVDESGKVPVATSCNCIGHFQFGNHCQHMEAVDRFFSRIYAREPVNPVTGMTDRQWQWYRNYEMAIGA